jgi:AraC-like DNA-binding protein
VFIFYIFDQFHLSYKKHINYEDCRLEEKVGKSSVLLDFLIHGHFEKKSPWENNKPLYPHSSSILIHREDNQVEIPKDIEITSLAINLRPDYFYNLLIKSDFPKINYVEKILAHPGQHNVFFNQESTSARMKMIIHEIMFTRFTGALKRIYIEGKVMELISLRLASWMDQENQDRFSPPHRFSPIEIEKIKEAQHIIITRYLNPPSISQLARQVGLNEFKLKNGFKAVFGTTIFGHLREHRMHLARSLLLSGDMNVTEVSYAVGYSNASHFALSFRKEFGINPNEFIRQRKYKI